MICTVATCGRMIASRASSTVSTDTPYAAMRPSSTSTSRASYVDSRRYTSDGGQCSWTRSRVSTSRFSRERSVQARNHDERVGVGDVRVGAAAHLRRDGQAVVRAAGGQERADELLGAAVAVHVGGVQERHAGVDGGSQHLQRRLVGHRPPVRAELPAPQPHDPDRPTRTPQQPALHGQGRYPARTMGRVTSIPIDAVVRVLPGRCRHGVGAGRRPAQPRALDPADAGVARRAGARRAPRCTAVSGPFARRGFPGLADVMTRRPLRPAGRRGAGRRDVHQDRARAQGAREHRRRPRRAVLQPGALERGRLPGGPAPPPTHRARAAPVPRRDGAIRASESPARGSRNRSPLSRILTQRIAPQRAIRVATVRTVPTRSLVGTTRHEEPS